ncbi:MAG: type II secretion system protein M [Pigmentiphaga sp.]|nr:type II secretion system protein M [Pigmentiphaga sp.]
MATFSFSSLSDAWMRRRAQTSERWRALSLRERRLVLVAALLVGLFLVLRLLVTPAWQQWQQARTALPLAQAQYSQIQALTQASRALQGQRTGQLDEEAQYALLESSLRQAGLAAQLHRGETGVQIDWEPGRSSLILDWLVQLPALTRLQPVELELVRQQDESGSWIPGLVSGHAVLQREQQP